MPCHPGWGHNTSNFLDPLTVIREIHTHMYSQVQNIEFLINQLDYLIQRLNSTAISDQRVDEEAQEIEAYALMSLIESKLADHKEDLEKVNVEHVAGLLVVLGGERGEAENRVRRVVEEYKDVWREQSHSMKQARGSMDICREYREAKDPVKD
ncbi:hypothetical protein CC78DRAFT_540086 [Lojkania enalia]|uniref:Uncharacterized protein n=1 Tax=Lojkania enalia TaxID=147567 RepID=A0A9P4TQJ9_9PLEO|nr:hypothetical protein CC78DRAFT_540086 [Didymosphaeria enalia]